MVILNAAVLCSVVASKQGGSGEGMEGGGKNNSSDS